MLDAEKIKLIIPMREAGKNNREISKELGIGLPSINYWIKRLKKTGYDVPKVKKGRPFRQL